MTLHTIKTEAMERFREKVNEVRREVVERNDQNSPIHDFGLKTLRGNEIFTITDFGNIEKFLSAELELAVRAFIKATEVEKKNEEYAEKDLAKARYPNTIRLLSGQVGWNSALVERDKKISDFLK